MNTAALRQLNHRDLRRREADLSRALEQGLFGFGPVAASLALLWLQIKINAAALDFHLAYWPAASRLLHGLSPYAVTHQQILGGTAFVYPALSAVAFVPFALIGSGVAQALYVLVCVACIPTILYTLDVRDWRVYGLAMLWLPVFVGWQSGNVTLPLTLAVALVWRHRERPLTIALLAAAAVSIKPFIWPLGLWMLATRRWRAAAWTVACTAAINALAWWVVGFNDLHVYLRLSGEVTRALWRGGYGVMAVGHHLGLGRTPAEGLLVAVSAAVAAAVAYFGLARRDERDALILAVILMLVASPLLWSHYFALLLIPMALSRPRLSLAWGIGVLMWPMPPRQHVTGWEQALAWVLTAVCAVIALNVGRADPRGPSEARC